MKKLVGGLGGAIGSRYLKNKNQLVFVEYSGFISKLDMVQSLASTVSQGTAIINGTWMFDCETGTMTAPAAALDLWWEQMTAVNRQMVPQGGAKVVNLGLVDFNAITPAAMQAYSYTTNPIVANNDATNKLVNGDVFCVLTRDGNYCKIQIVSYGYNLTVKWVTYKLNPAYARIGSGYANPEDIVVLNDESTAYVTERSGNILKVNLANANRAASAVVCSGLVAPQQLWVDEINHQAYVVEYANPGKLIRVDLVSGIKTILYGNLNFPVGLILSSDLTYAYVSEQGLAGISRIELSTGTKVQIASGLVNPFFLTWADSTQTKLLVPERDPANKISLVDVTKTSANVTVFIAGTAGRPSSIAIINSGSYCVCADGEVDQYFLTDNINNWLYKGIGYVPWNLIPANGKANTALQPAYPFQFPADSPFGGTLPVNIDHRKAWDTGIVYYKVLIDGIPRHDSWNDLVLNPVNGHYEIIELQKADTNGFYAVHNPAKVYYNSDLGCLLDSTSQVTNGLHALRVDFFNSAFALVSSMGNALCVNNQSCIASMDMPLLDGSHADPNCGYLKYVDVTHEVILHWVASHPQGFATYSFGVIKGAYGLSGSNVQGSLFPATSFVFDFKQPVSFFLGKCPKVAAFAESLYVATTVINGVGRQSQYDASASVAFCLAP